MISNNKTIRFTPFSNHPAANHPAVVAQIKIFSSMNFLLDFLK